MAFVQDHLPDLLRDVLLQPSSPDYAGERQAIEKIRNAVRPANAIAFVGYAHGLEDPGGVRELVAAAGQESLQSWNDGDLLSRKLAAAAQLDLLDHYVGDAVIALALATESARISGLTPVLPELPSFGQTALVRLADHGRTVSGDEPPAIQPFPSRGKVVELPPDDGGAVSNSTLRNQLQTERGAIRAAADAADARLSRLEKLAQRNSEEVDLLWWLLTPYSAYMRDWSSAGDAAIVVAGLEVGRRVSTDPPPQGTIEILAAALTKAGIDPREEIPLEAVVEAAPGDFLEAPQLQGAPDGWPTPLVSALQRKREGVGGSGHTSLPRARWSLQLVYDLGLARVTA